MALWFLLFLGISCFAAVHGQSSTDGYISIDCGITSNTTYSDSVTFIPYRSDDEFIDTGVKSTISSNYQAFEKQLSTLRSFPNGSRNCYALPVTQAAKYLVRASFMYGNYDGLNQASPSSPLLFDLYVDVNLWWKVNITSPTVVLRPEAIFVASADTVSVCLVKTGSGTPFISALELRPLKNTIYSYANATQSLALFIRLNLAPASNKTVRYPDDRYDRIWIPFTNFDGTTSIATDLTVNNFNKDEFEAPSVVMQTAVTPDNSSTLSFFWDFVGSGAPINEFYANLHFSELLRNTSRSFNVYLNDGNWYRNYTPPYLLSDAIYSTTPLTPSPRYQWALNSSGLSTLPPILNALEVYTPMFLTDLPTDAGDVDAITAIKGQYQLNRNWMGDPCAPKEYAWVGLNCSYGSNPPRITNVNLSSSGLTGGISSSFAKLLEIESLDLSYNNLTGSIPDALGSLLSLRVLNLTGNNLNGSIPASLLKRSQDGSLVLRLCNTNLLSSASSCDETTGTETTKKKKIRTPIIVAICIVPVVLLLVVICILYRLKKRKGLASCISVRPEKENLSTLKKDPESNPIQLENRPFTYKELEKITNNFGTVLGKGGFGTVYHGYLEDGTQVAVKTRSDSSGQGTKEFLAEVQNLVRIHHKSLVSLVGYCMEGDFMALVYEYMSEGTLQDHIRGRTHTAITLNWGKRLQIAIEAAQGLEYLHKGCQPPLVHRDVKTGNILLTERLEAKIADFGLSKAIQADVTNLSTAVVGTPGYLDPEYYLTYKLSDKSDVYSFGVVLLELITGEPPILTSAQNAHIVQRVRQRLANGNIEEVVDAKLRSDYDVNSIWKAADVAFKCTARAPDQRPTMTGVITELNECFTLENSRGTGEITQNSATETEQLSMYSPSAR